MVFPGSGKREIIVYFLKYTGKRAEVKQESGAFTGLPVQNCLNHGWSGWKDDREKDYSLQISKISFIFL